MPDPAAGLALQTLRKTLLTPRRGSGRALDALQYYARLGITTHRDSGAFHADEPATGIASENTYTMHNPFHALNREGRLPARLRIDFLHQDSPTADPPLPTLSQRLRNSFPRFGNDWLKTGGIGEFTGGGVEGLRAIARAGWRGEDHALNLAGATTLIANRETVNREIPITDLRWVISHMPDFPVDLANRAHALGIGVLVGWGPLRTGTNVGPPYRHALGPRASHVGFHSDGGDITVINPWLNFYTMITGRNLAGQPILGDQTLTRQETLWLATAANKWFIWEDDLGSIEAGNHADLAVLDRDYFTVPDEDIRRITSVLTIVGGRLRTTRASCRRADMRARGCSDSGARVGRGPRGCRGDCCATATSEQCAIGRNALHTTWQRRSSHSSSRSKQRSCAAMWRLSMRRRRPRSRSRMATAGRRAALRCESTHAPTGWPRWPRRPTRHACSIR